VADLLAFFTEEAEGKAQDKLEDALAKVEEALEKLEDGDRQGAAGAIEGAVGDLEAAVRKGHLATPLGILFLNELSAVTRLLAVDAIEEAKARGGDAKKIDEAESQLARGDARLAASRFKDAVARYKDAISKAEGA
jgi:DNA-binding GntR family transcriptional regulator